MDKDHADSIAISKILDKLQIKPVYTGKSKAVYHSPICKKQELTFWVYLKRNTWHDYALQTGGDLRDFACRYLKFTGEAHAPVDVSRWISNLTNDRFCFPQANHDTPDLIAKSAEPIRFIGLIRYLEGLGIPLAVAKRYTKELKVFNHKTGRTFIALGVRNESGGYELHNPLFNGFIQLRGITFFRGTNPQSREIHVFKNIFDFLSALSHLGCEAFQHDTIILHTLSNAAFTEPYILHYGYKAIHTWMDNDEAGRKADMVLNKLLKSDPQTRHIRMNRMYAPFKDVSEWHRNSLVLKGI